MCSNSSGLAPMLLVLVLAGALAAAEVPVHQPLGPQDLDSPLVPGEGGRNVADPREVMAEDLQRRLRQVDARIADLRSEFDGQTPALDLGYVNDLEQERAIRDGAWRKLAEVLGSAARQAATEREDVLDRPAAAANEEVRTELANANQLMIAQCYQKLCAEAATPAERRGFLAQGASALDAVTVDALPVTHRARYHYQQVWFAVERARLAEGAAARSQLVTQAQQHLELLEQRHPASLLLTPAREQMRSLSPVASDEEEET
ncbi:MAG: hypothetical protein ACOCZK_03475 [Planctomycetota bacterium]